MLGQNLQYFPLESSERTLKHRTHNTTEPGGALAPLSVPLPRDTREISPCTESVRAMEL